MESKNRHNKSKKNHQKQKGNLMMMESDSMGYTMVENQEQQKGVLTIAQWESVLSKGQFTGYSHNQVYFSFLKGIPDKLRIRIWMMLCNIKQQQVPTIANNYEQLLRKPLQEVDGHQIQVDIVRSYANNEKYLYTKPILHRVLHASINHGVIYTQGMNYIALHILIFCLQAQEQAMNQSTELNSKFESVVTEIFVYTVEQLKFIFGENLTNIFKIMGELQQMVMNIIPELTFHMAKFGLDCTVLFAQNYFCLMMYSSPPHSLAKALLDLFLLQGKNAIHALLIRMLELTIDQVVNTNTAEQLQKFVKFQIFDICADKLDAQRKGATCLQDFGLSFYTKTELEM